MGAPARNRRQEEELMDDFVKRQARRAVVRLLRKIRRPPLKQVRPFPHRVTFRGDTPRHPRGRPRLDRRCLYDKPPESGG